MAKATPKSFAMTTEALNRMMPMHLRLAADGRIIGCGSTLAKLLDNLPDGQDLIGRGLFETFELRRPSGLTTMAALRAHVGQKLYLSLHLTGRTLSFRGMAEELAAGAGMLINLSFGIGVIDAVRTYALTDGDFAPTDLAVEMMYLVEAKTAAMEALRGLAQRLQGDKQMAEVQALTDTLTGLRNRRALSTVLDQLVRTDTPFGLMHIDLDYFKAINDGFGHAAGDHVLRRVGEVLQNETRAHDTVARVGGDEFVVAFPGLTDADKLEMIARRIIEVLTQPMAFESQICRISASIGLTVSTLYEKPVVDRMQLDADTALYAAKRAGRGRTLFHGADADRKRA
ncbi:MAG: diguanylate cyclase [Paracoccaceae bacterium]